VAVAPVASYGDHIVAEHTFALLLALTRRLREAMRLNGDKRFSYGALRGIELHARHLESSAPVGWEYGQCRSRVPLACR
jgi:lactate dehydrogenase-like 2-hydroxyacid dehydrogenase